MGEEEATMGARRDMDWRAAIWAGIISGAVFLVMELIMVPVFLGGSPWGPPRMIAAIVMGQDVLPMPQGPPPTFSLGIILVAMVVHFALSIAFAVALAFIIRSMSTGAAIGVGAAFGLALYLINFYGFTAVFPWFAMARNWVSIVAHIVFGVVAAAAYRGLAKERPAPREGVTDAAR